VEGFFSTISFHSSQYLAERSRSPHPGFNSTYSPARMEREHENAVKARTKIKTNKISNYGSVKGNSKLSPAKFQESTSHANERSESVREP
jgi:hypothetical protein